MLPQAVLEGLQHQEATVERDPPSGTLMVTLHGYQKRALAWMLHREERARGARGGILAGMVFVSALWQRQELDK